MPFVETVRRRKPHVCPLPPDWYMVLTRRDTGTVWQCRSCESRWAYGWTSSGWGHYIWRPVQ